ncbi:hypothetical protein AB7M17_001106 [Bradyrhizobium sp. USDA 377]
MSSRRANARALRETREKDASVADRTLDQPDTRTLPSTRRTRGRRQPQAVDFQVAFEMPEPLPISDKELRAIEILLGDELLDLLSNDAKDS